LLYLWTVRLSFSLSQEPTQCTTIKCDHSSRSKCWTNSKISPLWWIWMLDMWESGTLDTAAQWWTDGCWGSDLRIRQSVKLPSGPETGRPDPTELSNTPFVSVGATPIEMGTQTDWTTNWELPVILFGQYRVYSWGQWNAKFLSLLV